MRLRTACYIVSAAFALAPGWAEDLRSLEGTTVRVKLDMPATSDGVDIRGGQADFRKLADGIRQYGVGVHSGQSIMITKVIIKAKNIEVHLGGGGFGTFSDRMSVAAASSPAPYVGTSRRERDLEDRLKYTDDYRERVRIRRELDDLRRDRERQNATNAALNAQTRQMVESNVMQKRAEAGSRFNIRYDNGVPAGASSYQTMVDALSKYVNFPGTLPPSPSAAVTSESASPLRKGLTVAQVEQILGPAETVTRKTEGTLEITVREYTSSTDSITTQFVGGVMVDYRIKPR